MCRSSSGVASSCARADVHEVDGLAVDLGHEVRHGVHPGLLGAPVERLPALDHVAAGRRPACRTPSRRRAPTAAKRVRARRRCRSSRSASGIVDGEGADRRCGARCGGHAATLEAIQERFVPINSTTVERVRWRTPRPGCWPSSACSRPAPTGPVPSSPHRLRVTDRTVRNDIDRLRGLGYPVDAVRGRAAATGSASAPSCRRCCSRRTRRSPSRSACAPGPGSPASRRPAPGRWPSSSTCSPTGSSAGSTRCAMP